MKLKNTRFGIVTDFYGVRISLEDAVRRLSKLGIRDLEIPGWHWDAGMQFKAIQARYGEPPFRMVFLVQSQQEGCENCICPFVLPEEDLRFCVQYVDDTLAEIKRRFEQWKSGNPNAWKTHLAETTFQGYGNSAFSFAFDKELSQMGA